MYTILIKNVGLLVKMGGADTPIPPGGLLIGDNVIQQIGPTEELPQTADTVINTRGMVALPGLDTLAADESLHMAT
jgi:8-oxoguanine deaminase